MIMWSVVYVFCFFKQKTAYEMRISDWSSDVCSSDLSEFTNRPDGLPGMLKTYGIEQGKADGVPEKNLKTYQTGAVYSATAKGECNFGEVFTTDGRLEALDLLVLEADKSYFPTYNVLPVTRTEERRVG